jgi:hypothetical protein
VPSQKGTAMDDELKKFLEANRWALAKSYLDRSDHSANILRGLLFTAAIASIGFVLNEIKGIESFAHAIPLGFFLAAAACAFLSWDLQKRKSIGRFKALSMNNLAGYERYKKFRNDKIDRFAGMLIAVGIVLELIIKLFLVLT